MRLRIKIFCVVVALPPQDTAQPTAVDLHVKFHSLLTITKLTSAINNSGHPKLTWSEEHNYTKHDIFDSVLDVITHILVYYEEIIAVSTSTSISGGGPVQHQGDNTKDPDLKASKDVLDTEGIEETDDKKKPR